MYTEHFGFDHLPFESLSNGTVYVDLPEHRGAYNTALFGLRSGEAFVKIVGEVGTGKTALCRSILSQLDAELIPVYLPNPAVDPADLLRSIADELAAAPTVGLGMHGLQKLVRNAVLRVARLGGRVVIFVDEAQTAPAATLEELRLLSNLESSQGRMVQAVLFGQPELDEKLDRYDLRQLQQRIAFSARLEPLDRRACRLYVRRRLVHSGVGGQEIFTPAAIVRIHRGSGGIPRLINMLCHKSLIAAYSDGEFRVGRRHVARALDDTDGIGRWKTRPLLGRVRLPRLRAPREPRPLSS